MDADRVLVLDILFEFAFNRHAIGLSLNDAYSTVCEEFEDIIGPMMARASIIGNIPGIRIGDEFYYRAEIKLVGLHDDLVRGISLDLTEGGHVEVASSVVTDFRRHNAILNNNSVRVGGEGGRLQMANKINMRVLEDQVWSRRNIAFLNSMHTGSNIRLIVRGPRINVEDRGRYLYSGEYQVIEFCELRTAPHGFNVYEFTLEREDDYGTVVEYREWDPFKSKLTAAILCGAQNIWIKPGSRVLVIYSRDDVRSGTTISHISDIVGPLGLVYVVDPFIFNHDAVPTFAQKRCNIVPIIQGLAPCKYRMLINMVDVMFGTLDTEEQFNIAYMNAMYFLQVGGHYAVCVEANRGDAPFASLVSGERVSQFKKMEHVTLEPFDGDHAYAIGGFRMIDLDEPVTFWTNSFWTEPHLNRGDGGHVTLYEKQKNLPTYMLFDSSLGYVLFRAHNVYDFERSYIAIEEYISHFAEVFELIAYHPFQSADEAQMYLNAASHETFPDHLIEFLVKHLPEPIKGNEHSYSLSLPQSSMSHPIVLCTNIACSRGVFHDEIMRGVRMNIDTFFPDMKRGDLEKAQLDLARNYCRQRLISPDKGKSQKKRGRVQASGLSRKSPMRKCQAAAKTNK